jgi:hypothetical protein
MIEYSRSHMQVLNLAALEDTSCECHIAIRAGIKRSCLRLALRCEVTSLNGCGIKYRAPIHNLSIGVKK